MSQVKEVKGLSWNCGSISTAKWTGNHYYMYDMGLNTTLC